MALGAGLVYAVSLYGLRRSQRQAWQWRFSLNCSSEVCPAFEAFGKKGPLLETAPLGLAPKLKAGGDDARDEHGIVRKGLRWLGNSRAQVVPYLCWVGVAAYTSWVADSWAVSMLHS